MLNLCKFGTSLYLNIPNRSTRPQLFTKFESYNPKTSISSDLQTLKFNEIKMLSMCIQRLCTRILPLSTTSPSLFYSFTKNELAKARKTRTSPSTLGLKKFGLGKLWVKKFFGSKTVLGQKSFLGQKLFWVKKKFF